MCLNEPNIVYLYGKIKLLTSISNAGVKSSFLLLPHLEYTMLKKDVFEWAQ